MLTSVILREIHHLQDYLTRFYLYVYKVYVFIKLKYVQITILLPTSFL